MRRSSIACCRSSAALLLLYVLVCATLTMCGASKQLPCGCEVTINATNETQAFKLLDCTNTTHVLLSNNLTNVTFQISGGTTVPTFTPTNKLANFSNIAVEIVGVNMTASSSAAPSTPILQLNLLGIPAGRLEAIRLSIVNSTLNLTHGLALHFALAIRHCSLLVDNSTIVHTERNSSQCSSFRAYIENATAPGTSTYEAPMHNMSVTVRGSSVRYDTDCVETASWAELRVGAARSPEAPEAWANTVSATVTDSSFVLQSHVNDSSVSEDNTPTPTSPFTLNINLTSGSAELILFRIMAANLTNILVALRNFSWSTAVHLVAASNELSTSLVCLATSVSRADKTKFANINISMMDGIINVSSPTKPFLISISGDEATLVVADIARVHGHQTTYGVATGDQSTRSVGMIQLTPNVTNDSHISVRDVFVHQRLVTGQGIAPNGSSYVSMAMLSAVACVLHIRSWSTRMNVSMHNVTTNVVATGGGFYSYLRNKLPFGFPFNITLGTVLISLIYFETAYSCSNLDLVIRSSAVNVVEAVETFAYNATESTVIAASITLLLLMSSCIGCNVVLEASNVTRPLMSTPFGSCSAPVASMASVCVNISTTSFMQASDAWNFGAVWLQSRAYVISLISEANGAPDIISSFYASTEVRNMVLTILNCTMTIQSTPSSPSTLLMERADENMIALYLLPVRSEGVNVTIRYPTRPLEASAERMNSSLPRLGAFFLGCVGNCTSVNSSFALEGSPLPSDGTVSLRGLLGGILSHVDLEHSSQISADDAVFYAADDRFMPDAVAAQHLQLFRPSRLLFGLLQMMDASSSRPLLIADANSTVRFNRSALLGYDALFGSYEKAARRTSLTASGASLVTMNTSIVSISKLELGCNVWGSVGTPGEVFGLPWQVIGLPHSNVMFDRSVRSTQVEFDSGTYDCQGWPTLTATLPLELPTDLNLDTTGASSVVAAATGVAIVSAFLGGSTSFDVQLLAMFGRSSCAPETLAASTGPSQWLMSPFYLLGDIWIVFGNTAVVCVTLAVQFVVVRCFASSERARRRRHRGAPPPLSNYDSLMAKEGIRVGVEDDYSVAPHYGVTAASLSPLRTATQALEAQRQPSQHPERIGAAALPYSSPEVPSPLYTWRTRQSPWETACTAARYPQVSYSVGALLVGGVVSSAVTALSYDGIQGGDVGSVATGVIGLLAVGCGWFGRYITAQQRRARAFSFRGYARRVIAASWAHAAMLPTGRWFPDDTRLTHGFLRNSVNPSGVRVSVAPLIAAQLAAAVAALPITSQEGCVAQWCVQVAIASSLCVVTSVWRSSRAPVVDALTIASQSIHIGICTASAIRVAPGLSDSTIMYTNRTLAVFVILSAVSSVVRSAHMIFVRVWESMRTHADMVAAPHHLTTPRLSLGAVIGKPSMQLMASSADHQLFSRGSLPTSARHFHRVARWILEATATTNAIDHRHSVRTPQSTDEAAKNLCQLVKLITTRHM